jgi:hypothetical protein
MMTETVKMTALTEWIVTDFGVAEVFGRVWFAGQVQSAQGTEGTMTVGHC